MELRSGKVVKGVKVVVRKAKAMAKDRPKRERKHHLLNRWILEKWELDELNKLKEAEGNRPNVESPPKPPAPPRSPREGRVWDRLAFEGAQPGPHGVTFRGMLGVANSVYTFAAEDFDKMELYDHVSYILSVITEPEIPLPKAIVSREVVVMAQQQLYHSRENLGARLALKAVMANLSLFGLRGQVNTCQNCFEKFRPPPTRHHLENLGEYFLGPCHYHPGQIRSYNDNLDADDSTRHLGQGFLSERNVKLDEFKIWMGTCYWDCCGGKLLEVGPDAGKRSQRKKHEPLSPWEIPNEYDGKVGCKELERHIPFE
ncbi:hypothetical protein F5Y02DRAFT_400254 [Annulohypoxylon stygium]|nr:hypothetical protein F5Y02DRAFT_400254 [Annulohypoxylon stygium]